MIRRHFLPNLSNKFLAAFLSGVITLTLGLPNAALADEPVQPVDSGASNSTPTDTTATPTPSSASSENVQPSVFHADPIKPLKIAAIAPSPEAPADVFGEKVENLEPITLNRSAAQHDKAKTLNLNPVFLSRAIEMNSFEALRKETKTDQEITLADTINYVLDQGMQIKISRESMNYQHFLTISALGSFLPTYSISYQLSGAKVPNLQTTSLAQTLVSGVNFPVFQGGSILYSLLGQIYREKAWREAYNTTVSDVFLDVYQKYMNLVLQRVLLQTYAKAVESDEEQLKLAISRLQSGSGTRYTVVQVQSLLAADKQTFLQQAVTMRQAGLALNLALNYPLSINLVPAERTLSEVKLFDDKVSLKNLLDDSLRFGSGPRMYEYFRQAALKNISNQAASLYPSVSFFVLYQVNMASVTPAGNSSALGGAATSAIASYLDGTFAGRVNNNSLGQQYAFDPTAGSTSTQGANTGPSSMPAASGGTPIATVQSGSLVSSGAVAPSIFGGGTGTSASANSNGSLQAPAGIFPGFFKEWQAGFQLSWTLPNLGQSSVSSILYAKVLARQAMMQANQELSIVAQQVRGDYLSILSTRQSIDSAAASAASFRQALGYAKSRFSNGVNTQLEVIQAQHDYINALTTQAQAIVNSNVAQAQLLHDMGMISVDTLTTGYHPGSFVRRNPETSGRWKNNVSQP